MITFTTLILVGLTGLVSVQCGKQKNDELDVMGASIVFKKLQTYLESNVNSDGVQDNLDAAYELINNFYDSADQTTCFFGLCRRVAKEETLEVMGAKRFVHLLSVSNSTSSLGCNEITFSYLHDLNKAHWLLNLKPMRDGRHHLDTFGRVDRLLDEVLETLISKCGLFVDRLYEIKLRKLSPSLRRDIFNLTDEDVSSMDMYDYDASEAKLIERFDPEGYQASLNDSLQRESSRRFIDFCKLTHQKIFRTSCESFESHFKDVIDRFKIIIPNARRYNIELSHSKPVEAALARVSLCSLVIGLMSESSVYDVARNIYRKHLFA